MKKILNRNSISDYTGGISMKARTVLVLVLLLGTIGMMFGQSNGDYQTRDNVTGDWSGTSTWQKYVGGAWGDVTTNPTSLDGVITIRSGATVTIQGEDIIEADELVVNGQLIVDGYLGIVDGTGTDLVVNGILQYNTQCYSAGQIVVNGSLDLYDIQENDGSIVVNGSISDKTGAGYIIGTGSFTLVTGATLVSKQALGIRKTTTPKGGVIRCTTAVFESGTNYIMSNGNGNQTAWGLPNNVSNLTIDLSHGTNNTLTIRNAVTIGSKLTFIEGSIAFSPDPVGSISYAAGASLEYAGYRLAQTTGGACFPDLGCPTNVIINNTYSGVTLGNTRTIAGDLILLNGAFNIGSNNFTVQGTTEIDNGSLTRGTGTYTTNGYSDPDNFFSVTENANNLQNFSVTSFINNVNPGIVRREWSISGSATGAKDFVFEWSSSEDGGYVWGTNYPILSFNDTPLTYVNFVEGGTRVLTSSTAAFTDGTYAVDHQDSQTGDTLPVELASFTAVLTSINTVTLNWLTHSETGVRGFYVLRNTANVLEDAIVVSNLINATNTSNQMAYNYVDRDVYGNTTYYYWLQIEDIDGGGQFFGPSMITVSDGSGNTPVIPLVTQLKNAYPNPFNPRLNVAFDIAEPTNVKIMIYNVKGQLVKTLLDSSKQAGYYSVEWNASSDTGEKLGTGVYFVKMKAGKLEQTKKVSLLK